MLTTRLAQYNSLIDVIVEMLAREIQDSEKAPPASTENAAGGFYDDLKKRNDDHPSKPTSHAATSY